MEERTFRLLEFSRVLEHLSGYAVSEPARKACLRIVPIQSHEGLVQSSALLRQALEKPELITGHLSRFPSLEGVFHFLEAEDRILDVDGLWALAQTLGQASTSAMVLVQVEDDWLGLLRELGEECPVPKGVQAALKRCLNSDGDLRDESSPELAGVRQNLRDIQKRCTKKVNDFLQEGRINPEHLQDEFLTISSDRYVLALKANFKGKVQGIIHDYSQSGETCYFEPLFLVDLNNRLQELKQEERAAERRVLQFLTSMVRQEREKVYKAYGWLVELDVLAAKLHLAEAFQGNCMASDAEAPVDLRNVRHPLLVLDGSEVRPLDIQIRQGERALVISGGNSGGKTVCLKTLGLIALMHLSCLPVPADRDSRLPFFKKVFVFLGDEQSLADHLSTFTAQIGNLRRIWENVDGETLVILDEFGAGTDPSQGAALAQAVLDELLEKEAVIGVATHFPALKAYALAKDKVRAASVLFDPRTKRPLYRLAYDQVGASRALDVAREHGLPEGVLRRAEEYLLLDGEDSAKVLERLNELVVTREKELDELHREKDRLAREEAALKQRYARQVQDLLAESKQISQQILREWKSGRTSRKAALKKLAEQRSELASNVKKDARSEAGLDFASLSVGDAVSYPAWNKSGTIQELDEKKQRCKVDFGGVSLWLDAGDLAPAEPGKSGESRTNVPCAGLSGDVPVHLDLRGQRVEEAGNMLIRFLDTSVVQGRQRLEIIHGKGTGVLREVVHDILQEYPGVQGFDLATAEQGGDGVTLVEL